MEGDLITLQDVFLFDYSAGVDADGRFLGTLQSTGIRPKFTEKLAHYGINLPALGVRPGGRRLLPNSHVRAGR